LQFSSLAVQLSCSSAQLQFSSLAVQLSCSLAQLQFSSVAAVAVAVVTST